MKNDMNSSSLEIRRAQIAIDTSRLQVVDALDALEFKLQARSQQIQGAIDNNVERAREITDKVRDIYTAMGAPKRYAQENPYVSIAVCAIAGFFVGGMISRSRNARMRAQYPAHYGEYQAWLAQKRYAPSGQPDLGRFSRGLEAESIGSSHILADPRLD